MLLQLISFLLLLTLLFFGGKKIHIAIYRLVYLVSLNKKIALWILAFIILPGTIIHELSHFFTAVILHVKTGKLSVWPEVGENEEIQAGKLMLGKVDPFRHTVIGLAPIIIGLVLIYLIAIFFLPSYPQLPIINYQLSIIIYLIFTISVTMFSSKKDLESMLIAGPLVILIIGSLYKIGVRVILDDPLVGKIIRMTGNLNLYLLMASIVDYVVLLLLNLLSFFFRKILKRKIVEHG